MINNTEIAIEAEQILARISAFRHRISERPEHRDATAIGFLDIGLETAQSAITGGYQCMKSESGLPPGAIDYEVEYGMTALRSM